MEGLKTKKYLQTSRKRFDPIALFVSTMGLAAILFSLVGVEDARALIDPQALVIVLGGTVAILLFQFDFSTTAMTFVQVFKSFMGTPEKAVLSVMTELDQAIMQGRRLSDLADGAELTGELLSDIVYMQRQGLVFAEIDAFVTARIADEYLGRSIAVSFLSRGAMIAPSLGLFGTVMGLIGVLKSLANPSQLGPAMSLALMTTAYGAVLGTLIFTPIAGRLEHHNVIFLEAHKQLMAKIGLLLEREDRSIEDRTTDGAREAAA